MQICPTTAMQSTRGRGSIALDLSTRRGEWSVSRPNRALPLGKEPPIPIEKEARSASELAWTHRLEEKSFASAGNRTSVIQSVVRHYID
jgi:Tfp pilus assembly protein PilX